MTRTRHTVALVILLCLNGASGCVRPSLLVLTNYEREYPKTTPESIGITTVQNLSKPITEIGYMYVRASSLTEALKEAREKAAQSGGEMIIDMRAEVQITQVGAILFLPVYDTSYSIEGIVIRFIH